MRVVNRVRVAVLAACLLTGCAGQAGSGGTSTADYQGAIRHDGITYGNHSFTERVGTPFGAVDEADCDDVGEDARGNVFPDQPRQVESVTFEGYDPAEVLGTRLDRDTYRVWVAEGVPEARADRIRAALDRVADSRQPR